MTLASRGKSSLLAAVSALTGRHAVLLPREASPANGILEVSAPYRVTPPHLILDIADRSSGALSVSLLAYEGHFPRRTVWERREIPYDGPQSLVLDVVNWSLTLGGVTVGSVDPPIPSRRIAFRLELESRNRSKLSRTTGHYLPAAHDDVGEAYFRGADYVDYEAQARSEAPEIMKLLERHRALDPILEVGAATGVILEQLQGAGRILTGVDSSAWAVDQAERRLGAGKVVEVDVETSPLPDAVESAGPFATLLLWAVLEHFHDPFAVISKLSQSATADATLIINTTNAASLSHRLFGNDWEGYFDWTHWGVDVVSVESLRSELPRLGWKIEEMYTHSFWHAGADPDHAVFRDAFAHDARFSRLLRSRNLGDFLVCVARRTASAG